MIECTATTINSLSINLSTVRVLQTVATFEDFPILPLTWNLKHGGWKTILSSWGPASWQVAKHQLKTKWIDDSNLHPKKLTNEYPNKYMIGLGLLGNSCISGFNIWLVVLGGVKFLPGKTRCQ